MAVYNRFPVTLVKGRGSYVWDDNGQRYLDYTSGIAVCNLGHVPDVVKQQLTNQIEQLWHTSNLYYNEPQEKLATLLTKNSCADRVFFSNSGAEANEAAIKLARKYAAVKHTTGSKGLTGTGLNRQQETSTFDHDINSGTIITFKQSFHGRTMATLSATGQQKVQQGFAPLLPGFRYVEYNSEEALKAIDEINKVEVNAPIAVLLELVQGEGGVVPADYDWIQQLATLCQKHDILLIVDEIQTGMGRTGSLFAYEHYDIKPDIITLAKGLGSGFPLGATLAKQHVADCFAPGSHGSTFGGNHLAMAAGIATVEYMLQPRFLKQVKENSDYFIQRLSELKNVTESIVHIRGKGFMLGIELTQQAIDVVHALREQNVLVLTAGERVLRILPPLTTTKEEIDAFIEVLAVCL